MKKLILFCFTCCAIVHLNAQHDISVFFAPASSTFKYTDSQGNKDPNLRYEFRPSFGLNYSKVFNSGVFIRPELGYKNFGAISLLNDQKVDWSLHYLDFNIGCGYQKHFGSVVPFAGIAPYFSYLFKGKETFGSTVYDLLGDNGLKQIDWGLNIFAGVKYQTTKANSLFIEIRNVTGLLQLDKNSVNGQNEKIYNRALSFHFGISFNIVKGVKRKEETPEITEAF